MKESVLIVPTDSLETTQRTLLLVRSTTTNAIMVRVCQLNVSGLSTQSKIALDRLCDVRRVDILALQEVGPPPPSNCFTNMTTFATPNDRGVALSVRDVQD